jgi:hypothetical protein
MILSKTEFKKVSLNDFVPDRSYSCLKIRNSFIVFNGSNLFSEKIELESGEIFPIEENTYKVFNFMVHDSIRYISKINGSHDFDTFKHKSMISTNGFYDFGKNCFVFSLRDFITTCDCHRSIQELFMEVEALRILEK